MMETPSTAVVNELKNLMTPTLSLFDFDCPREFEIIDNIHKYLLELQIQSEVDIITVRERGFDSTPNEFDKRFSKSIDYLDKYSSNHHIAILPILRLDTSAKWLKRKINIAIDNGANGIIFKYGPYADIQQGLEVVREASKDKDIWFHLSGVSKKSQGASVMHAFQVFGFDTFSLLTPRGGGKETDKPKKYNFEWLDKKTLGFLNQDHVQLKCKDAVCKGHSTKTFIDTYNSISATSGALKYHNSVNSNYEFQLGRESIKDGETIKYLSKKKNVNNLLSKQFKINLDQQNLRTS